MSVSISINPHQTESNLDNDCFNISGYLGAGKVPFIVADKGGGYQYTIFPNSRPKLKTKI